MSDEKDILIELFKDQMTHARHHESLRATISNLIITISGITIGFIVYDDQLNSSDFAPIFFLFLLGAFGALFSMKHYQHLRRHQSRAEQYRNEIERRYETLTISEWLTKAKRIDNDDFPFLGKIGLHKYWMALHIMIVVISFSLFTSILIG